MKVLFFLLLIFTFDIQAQERGFDPETSVTIVDLICGKVGGKFVLDSTELRRVWYVFSEDLSAYQK